MLYGNMTYNAFTDAMNKAHGDLTECSKFVKFLRQANFPLYQDLDSKPSCTVRYRGSTPVELGLINGSKRFADEVPHRDFLSDNQSIAEFDIRKEYPNRNKHF